MTLNPDQIIQFSKSVCDNIIQFGIIPSAVEIDGHHIEYNDVWELAEALGLERLLIYVEID